MNPGQPTPRQRRALLGLALLLFLSYGYFFQGGGWNQAVRLDLTWAMVEQGSLTIDSYAANTGDVASFQDHLYSTKAPGVSFLAVPFYAALWFLQGLLGLDPGSSGLRILNAQLLTWLLSGGGTALLAWLLGRMAGRWLGAPAWAQALTMALYGLCTMAFPFATVLFGHQLAAVAGVGALYMVWPGRGGEGGAGRGHPFWAGLLAGGAFLMEYPAVVFAPAALGLLLHRQRSLSAALRFCLGALLPVLLAMAYHQLCFGSPFTTGYKYHADMFRHPEEEVLFDLFAIPSLERLAAVTVGAKRGLFALYPACALGLGGAILLLRRPQVRPVLLACSGVVAWFFLLNAAYPVWDGGYCSGPRYLLPAVPLLMLPAWLLFATRLRALAWALAAVSLFCATAITLVNPMGPFQVDSLLGDYILPALFSGQVSANFFCWWPAWMPADANQAANASLNLGELLGLDGPMSILPLLGLGGLGGVMLTRALKEVP